MNDSFKNFCKEQAKVEHIKWNAKGFGTTKRGANRAKISVELNKLYSYDFDQKFDRTEALRMAKIVAMASLPARRTTDKDRVKILRFGKDFWVKVTVSTKAGKVLPFGEDRFVLAGIIHLAIENHNPVIFFKTANELLKMFGINSDSQGYKLLRERFQRIQGLSFHFQYGRTKDELKQDNCGENIFCIGKYCLPSKNDIKAEEEGQMVLDGIVNDPELNKSPYGVKLSYDFFAHITENKNQMVVPVKLLKLFKDRPIGWDFCLFVVGRCYAAKTVSALPHREIMELFKHGKEDDRKTIYRLKKYLEEIHLATDNRLKVWFDVAGKVGRKKIWNLVISPSQELVRSGKRPSITDGE